MARQGGHGPHLAAAPLLCFSPYSCKQLGGFQLQSVVSLGLKSGGNPSCVFIFTIYEKTM